MCFYNREFGRDVTPVASQESRKSLKSGIRRDATGVTSLQWGDGEKILTFLL